MSSIKQKRVLTTTIPSIFSSINALDIGGNALVLHNLSIGKGGNNWAKKAISVNQLVNRQKLAEVF